MKLRLLLALLPLSALLSACRQEAPQGFGDAEHGRVLLRQYGCGSCHDIPGVAAAVGNVGPPLAGVGRRVYLAGILPNTPENMMRWIIDPRRFDARTAMPTLGVSEAQARDMVAYLSRLK